MSATIVLAYILASLVCAISIQLAVRIIKVNNEYDRFKKALKLNMLPKPWWPSGHDPEMGFNPYSWLEQESLHRRYGRTFGWIGGSKPIVSTIDLDLIKKMTLDDPFAQLDRPDLELPFKELSRDNIAFANSKQWARIRRAMTPALTVHKIKSPEISGEIDRIIERLLGAIERRISSEGNEKGLELDFGDLMAHFTTDVVFSCFYGQRDQINFDGQRNHHVVYADIGFEAMMSKIVEIAKMLPSLAPVFDFIASNFHPAGKTRRTLIDFIKRQTKLNFEARKLRAKGIESSAGNGSQLPAVGKRCVVDTFIDAYHEGKLSHDEYVHSSFFFYFAASKTTADSIALTAYFLAKHEDVQDKLRDSIMREGLDSEYLGWCINESMRLQPPSLVGCARTLTSDLELGNVKIPKGTLVTTPAYTIHRLREYWGPDANVFRPERFANAKDFHPVQFLPFGAGKRSCPGKDFAYFEARKTLVALMTKYKFEVCDRTCDTLLFKAPFSIMTIYKDPIYLRLSYIDQSPSTKM